MQSYSKKNFELHIHPRICTSFFWDSRPLAGQRPAIAWPSDSHEQIPNFFESVWKKWWESYSNVYQHHHRSIKHQGLRIWWRCNDILTLRESTGTFPFPTFWPLASCSFDCLELKRKQNDFLRPIRKNKNKGNWLYDLVKFSRASIVDVKQS